MSTCKHRQCSQGTKRNKYTLRTRYHTKPNLFPIENRNPQNPVIIINLYFMTEEWQEQVIKIKSAKA